MTLNSVNTTIPELSSRTYTATINDADGDPILLTAIASIKLTVTDADGTVINSRDRQDVLNTNDGTMHATSGLFTWLMQPADNVIVGTPDDNKTEEHVVIIEIVLTNGTRENHRLEPAIKVTQITHLTE